LFVLFYWQIELDEPACLLTIIFILAWMGGGVTSAIRVGRLAPHYCASHKQNIAGSRRVLTTAMDDWSENLFALAPV
jgi:hypothetical protein